MLTWPQAPSSLGDSITLPEKRAASSEGLDAGESLPQPEEPGECGFFPFLSVQQRLLLLGTWQFGRRPPEAWLWGQKGLAYKISFGEMSPGTGSISSCHCRPARQHQAATAWLLSCHWSTALPWAWAGLPSLAGLQMPWRCYRMSELTAPLGTWDLTGTPGSSIPPSSSFLLADIPVWMSRWGIPIPTLQMQTLGCTAEPPLTPVPCHWMKKRRASTKSHQ